MKRSNIASGALLCVCQMGIAGVLFSLSYIQNKFISMQINYPVLLIAVLAVYSADVIMLRRGMMMSVYAALQAIFAVGAVILWISMVSVEEYRLWTEVSTGLFYAVIVISSAVYAYTSVSPRSAALWFDGVCIAAAAAFLFGEYMQIPCAEETIVMCIISTVGGLVMLVVCTASRDEYGGAERINAPQGKTVVIGVMSGVAALAVLISAVLVRALHSASGAAAAVMKWCANVLSAAVGFLYRVLYTVVDKLANKIQLPKVEDEAIGLPYMPGGEIDYGQAEFQMPVWAYIAAGIIFVSATVVIAFGLRGMRTQMWKRRLKTARVSRERVKAKWLLFSKLRAEMMYLYRRIKQRRSAAGLLDYCIRRAAKTAPRKADESGQKYLLRLARSGFSPQLCDALTQLAGSVEKDFYSPCGSEIALGVYKTLHKRKNWKKETASS